MDRRSFLGHAFAAGVLAGFPYAARARPRARAELPINRIVVQNALGRRLTPVAPNAYAAYRGFEVKEPELRISSSNGLEGICHNPVKPELLRRLIGLDAFALFECNGDVITGPAAAHR